MIRTFTMRKTCPACLANFVITSAASMYCQNKDCQDKRRRDDYKAKKLRTGPWDRLKTPAGSDGHLERALESGE